MLLQTKLYRPQPRPGTIPRPHLIQQLNQGLHGKLTLVTAPAGYGKTTLVTNWLQQQTTPTAWYSLDEGDNNPAQFLAYIITALSQTLPDFDTPTLNLLQSNPPLPLIAVISQLINDLVSHNTPIILVLDDFHVVQNDRIYQAVNFLVENSPSHFHLLITSREQVPLPALSRLRGRGLVAEFTTTQLRFSNDEATAFFRQTMGLSLTPNTITDYAQKSEGWVTGLQLAALAIQQGHDPAGFPSQHPFIFNYLIDEVYARQPSHIQQFWQQTAILSRLSAPLCSAVTGQTRALAQQTLADLEQANLFLQPLDSERRWYRYHHLLAEFLQNKVEPATAQQSHQRAADWFAEHDAHADAIAHAFAINDFDSASQYILQIADELWTRGSVATLQAWLLQLPEEMILSRPGLALYLAWTYCFDGQTQRDGTASFRKASHLLDRVEPTVEDKQHGHLFAIRAALASVQRQVGQAITFGEDALAKLEPDQAIWQGVVGITLGIAYQITGNIPQATTTFREAARQNRTADNLSGALFAYNNWGSLLLQQHALPEAELAYQEAYQLIEEAHAEQLPICGQIFIGLGQLRWRQGQLAEAAQHLQAGTALSAKGGFPTAEPLFQLAQVQLLLGNQEGADEASGRAETALQNPKLNPHHRALAQAEQTKFQKLRQEHQQQSLIDPLSDRELEILRLVADGYANQQIADQLVVALSTIKWHINNIYGKLNVRRRTQAIQKARTLNLLN